MGKMMILSYLMEEVVGTGVAGRMVEYNYLCT